MSLIGKVSAEIELPGVCVQIADYRWHQGTQIVELGDTHLIRRRTFPAEIGVCADIEGRRSAFGTLMYFPAEVPVHTSAAANDELSTTINCRFSADWLGEVTNLPSVSHPDLARCLDLNNGRIDQALRWMGQEVSTPGFADRMMISSLATFVAVELTRFLSTMHATPRARTRDGTLLPSHLKNIVDYIEANLERCPTLDEIALVSNVSSAHLRRAFKNTTGSTLHQYIETLRLNKAKEMLANSDLPLKAISYRLGFAAPSAFSSAFRKLQNETPSRYRCRTRN